MGVEEMLKYRELIPLNHPFGERDYRARAAASEGAV
jgi:hypothetical protein